MSNESSPPSSASVVASATAAQQVEMKAIDLVKRRDLIPPIPSGERTVTRLWDRFWRRPAGCSERLWKKVGEADPFARPPEHARPEHRGVYASGRFVRFDQADAGKSGKGKGDLRAKAASEDAKAAKAKAAKASAASGDSAGGGWQEKIAALKAQSEANAAAKKAAAKAGIKSPLVTAGASGLFTRPTAKAAPKAATKAELPTNFDRSPPIIASKGSTGSARMSITRSAAVGKGATGPPAAIDRAPPIVKAGVGAGARDPFAAGAKPTVPAPKATTPGPKAPVAAPRPAAVAPKAPVAAPRPASAAPKAPILPPPAAKAPPPAAKAPAQPPIVAKSAPVAERQPDSVVSRPETAVAASAAKANDAPKSTTTPSAASPATGSGGKDVGSVLAVQPPAIKLAGALNTPGPAQVVPVRRPPKQDESSLAPEDKRPAPAATPGKPVNLDDPFAGAAQEGRVRIGRAKKPEPKP